MTSKMNELKTLLKEKVVNIKELRKETKEKQRKGKYAGAEQWKLLTLKQDCRAHHIAYCELRGRTRKEIEQNSYTDPDEGLIQNIKETYYEDVCIDAA